jgi:hypothetical protein
VEAERETGLEPATFSLDGTAGYLQTLECDLALLGTERPELHGARLAVAGMDPGNRDALGAGRANYVARSAFGLGGPPVPDGH